ncbi:putative MFS family arabinose efflux permease [Chitinophaga niastensis]|uniref:Putative MFS family arabinose efflux permease n=1 Tax=Chitinophaga niastensis TaxID=536980 RepID=A0A2P8HNB4_CHINA|nr:MFS transporter [Chitinophaga niastensis]PSL47692.1 putative MFS family arabinose efflux permease [Chitinophaga niastensis]
MDTTASPKNDPYASLRFPEFKYYLVIRFAIVFALAMQFAIIEWKVYEISKDPFSLGLIGLSEVIPAVLLAPFAGHLVDKREKRGILLKCVIAYIIISAGLFLLTWDQAVAGISRHWVLNLIYLLVFSGGIVRAFTSPANFTLMSLLVPRELYANAATWSSSAWQIGGVIGPALGGLLIHWFGVHWSMLLVVFVFFPPLFSLIQIKPKPIYYKSQGESFADGLTKGIRFVWKTKVVLGAMALDMFAVLFGGAVAMLPAFATDVLHVGSQGYGLLRSAPAVGALVTMFILAHKPLVHKPGIKLLAAVFGFGLCIIVFGLSTSFYLSIAALLVSGALDGISVIIRQTILQLKTPDDMRGRVASVSSMFVGSSNELGAFESGFMARAMGLVTSVVFGGCVTLGVVVTTYVISPAMRKLDLKP